MNYQMISQFPDRLPDNWPEDLDFNEVERLLHLQRWEVKRMGQMKDISTKLQDKVVYDTLVELVRMQKEADKEKAKANKHVNSRPEWNSDDIILAKSSGRYEAYQECVYRLAVCIDIPVEFIMAIAKGETKMPPLPDYLLPNKTTSITKATSHNCRSCGIQ